MALITEIITEQNFEIVKTTVGSILNDEIQNQIILQPLRLTEDVTVFRERSTNIDKTEEVVVNVLSQELKSDYGSQSDGQNNYIIFIDVYAHGKAKDTSKVGTGVSEKLDKYVGLCRYILESHKYVNLGLPKGTLGGKKVVLIQWDIPSNNMDTNFGRMARISFSVKMSERQEVWQGEALNESVTQSQLELSDDGYKYIL